MRHIVIGCGEVGRALMEVLQCDGHDPQKGLSQLDSGPYDVMHVCMPYSEGPRPASISENIVWKPFCESVVDYQNWFKPRFTVIHSTVPIGTSDRLGASHSPVRGRHPYLAESLKTFVKYVGGRDSGAVALLLQDFGIPAVPVPNARDCEAAKLFDLMQFGSAILLEKEIHRYCSDRGLSFDIVYSEFNRSYTDGYAAMGEPQHCRPSLEHRPGPILGHCVVQNMPLLDSPTARQIIETNRWLARAGEEVQK